MDMAGRKPRLLDLFCGAGGAAMGYYRASFQPYGIDNRPQPHYPFPFLQMDALEAMERLLRGEGLTFSSGETLYLNDFDAYHASPPCQAFSTIGKMYRSKMPKKERVDLIKPIRSILIKTGKPYIIENVPGSPLINPVRLCGSTFCLGVRRHRHFEANFYIAMPICFHKKQSTIFAVYGDHPENCRVRTDGKGGNIKRAPSVEVGSSAMGIDWMDWKELTQAIPPAYTEYIGKYLMEAIDNNG
jgi:DNA (cytosine-5)-methyltransferase 1